MCAVSRMKQSKRNKSRAKKPRKPKFLSLKEHLAPPQQQPQPEPQAEETSKMAMQQQDPNLNNPDSDSPVACLLGQGVEPDGGPTITDIFGSSSSNSSSAVVDEVLSPASPSVNWEGVDGDGLARRALRGRERWVFCRSKHKPSTSSSEIGSNTSRNAGVGVDLLGVGCRYQHHQGLLLKLDYEEVLTAWSDRGSLYIDGEAPQVVPDLYHPCEDGDDDDTAPHVVVEVGNGGALRVPEMEEQSGKEGDRSTREARVMRYKEKRRSRLFAKRIRYEVRKRNAEKRPRIKGRFVKRVDAI